MNIKWTWSNLNIYGDILSLLLILVTSSIWSVLCRVITVLIFMKSQLLIYLYFTDFLKHCLLNICFKIFNFFLILLWFIGYLDIYCLISIWELLDIFYIFLIRIKSENMLFVISIFQIWLKLVLWFSLTNRPSTYGLSC